MNKLVLSALTLTLSVGAAIGTAAPAQAADPDGPSTRWLGKQLTNGVVHNEAFDFDDFGLTIDVGIALIEMGGADDDVKAVRKAIAKNVDSYTTGVDFGSSDVFAGSTAKAAAFAQLVGRDPADFGGVDLIKRLGKRVAKGAPIAGRLEDKGMDDFANVIGQSFAVQALLGRRQQAGQARHQVPAQAAVQAGYFRLSFTEDKAAPDQTCDGGKRKTTSAPDTDATALAVLSLLEVPKPSKAVRNAIDDAVGWLSRAQGKNGSFGGGTSTEAPNANSTGLAAWAWARPAPATRPTRARSG